MAVVDMPLEELKAYTGKNPCPADIDTFWDKALEEMRNTDPQISITPAEFQTPTVECFDMYFTGVGGSRVYAKLLKPRKIEKPCPAVLEFHGYTGDSGPWTSKLGYAANGFIVASLDCRGQGGKSDDFESVKGTTFHGHIIRGLDDAPEKLLFRQIFLDTAQLASIVMDMDCVDETRVGAKGGSQGGALTIACAALEPRIKLAAPMFPFLCDYKRVWEMDLCTGAYIELRDFFRRFDPLHKREDEIFTKLGYIDLQNIAKRIKAKVLMFTALRDDTCPPSSQFAAYNKMTCEKDMVIYHDFGHEALPDADDMTFTFLSSL